jgi:hypothetical protein
VKMSHLSDIEEQMNAMKKTMEEIGEKLVSEKEKSIQNFLKALVQCGEISQEKRESIESNVSLAGFFIKDLDDSSVMEDEEMFEGRRTFPEEKSHDTNQFIIRYIREKFPDCNVGYHGHAPYCHEEKGDKQIYTAGCDVKIILSGLKMKHKTSYRFSSAGETECYWDHDGFGCISYPGEDGMTHNMVLRGGRFEELDEIMKILFE